MLHRPSQTYPHRDSPHHDPLAELMSHLRAGVAAMENPVIEAEVEAYFARHPQYSRDLIHVAAVACRFRAAEKLRNTFTEFTNNSAAVTPRI